MATIEGTFSGKSYSVAHPYIEYSYTQSIAGNYSDVTAKLYFYRSSSYSFYNNNNNHSNTSTIDGVTSATNTNYDTRAGAGNYLIRTVTQRVNHNPDGIRTVNIGWSGNTQVGAGTYNFSQTISLPTIPREAYINSSIDFTIGNTIPLSITNDGSCYLKSLLYVNGSLIKTTNHGQVTSATITLDGTETANVYAQTPNTTAVSCYVRIKSYGDSAYSNQIGVDKDYTGTAYVDSATNSPTFSNYAVTATTVTVNVTDKYDNILETNYTNTLTGINTWIIKGYSSVLGTVISSNKGVAKNGSTMSRYRFASEGQGGEVAYSTGDVGVTLTKVTSIASTMTAIDSRGLFTTATLNIGGISNYTPIAISSLAFNRDNLIDAPTKLVLTGNFWKKYFGNDSTSNPSYGVINTVTAHYRYKETTASWASQTWTPLSVTSDADGVVSFDDYVNGDLGAGGFTSTKSFNIEVRLYDKLTAVILEGTLNIGIPVQDWTQTGTAILGKVNPSDTATFQNKGAYTIKEIGTTPSDPASGTEAHLYIKGDKLIFQFNDGGTVRYKYLDMTGTGVTWVATTSAP